MNRLQVFSGILGVLVIGGISNRSWAAPPVVGFVGSAPSSVAGCPYITWRLARHDNGNITGIAYYNDIRGVSMVTGTIDQNGKFNLKLTSQIGDGPTGDVVGQKTRRGTTEAILTGAGCANMHFGMKAVDNMAQYHQSNG